jgi:Kdo2-lipid IVA lauroyltransferase/acyltransferase
MSKALRLTTRLRYGTETLLVKTLYLLLRAMPVDMASYIGGFFARTLGRLSMRSDVARRNLQRAMPELSQQEIENTVTEMWDNLGRTFAEFPHIASLDYEQIKLFATLEGEENIFNADANRNGNIYFTGHLANWELGPRLFFDLGFPVSIVYRKGNNPGLGRVIQRLRSSYLVNAIPKGQSGSREIIRRLKAKERIGILVDQKMNDGIKSSFFGLEAMTAPAIARLALKYHCPVLPVRVIRLDGCNFRVNVYPALDIKRSGDNEKDVDALIHQINTIVEEWIREYPGQWIWLHNRWSTRQ